MHHFAEPTINYFFRKTHVKFMVSFNLLTNLCLNIFSGAKGIFTAAISQVGVKG